MLSDPIAALATPPGRSALAVIRLSGEGAFAIAEQVVRSFRVQPERTARLAFFLDAEGHTVDQGLYLTFPSPRSVTGEDLVELTCHGGRVASVQVLTALHAAGARAARPGEFTLRAVLNRKMDLLQAEAVGDLVDAGAKRQARSALDQLDGGLSRRIAHLRDRLIALQALLAYDVDFPGEDDGPVSPERVLEAHQEVMREVAALLATAPAGERLRVGAVVVLAGPPNAGKSSLFNTLLGHDRALVTEIPGTTRDAIEAATEFEGWPVRLVDTAGLWEARDRLDRLGVEVSRRYLAGADLVLLCLETGRVPGEEERALATWDNVVVLRTKADHMDAPSTDRSEEDLPVSIVTGEGLERLRSVLVDRLFREMPSSDYEPVLTRERHRLALDRAHQALVDAGPFLKPGGDAVLGAHHIENAVVALDELIGVVDPEDILTRIFSQFCVGK